MYRQLALAFLVPLLMPAITLASPVTYDFSVNADPTSPLAGVVAEGTFSLDSSSLLATNNFSTNILTSLAFTWNGTAFTAATANTGLLSPALDEVTLVFGNKCSAGGCSAGGPDPNDWYADLQFPALGMVGDGYLYYSDGTGDIYTGYITSSPAPLPASAWLMLSGLGGLGVIARWRPAGRPRLG